MSHYPCGVFVPNRTASRGGAAVVKYVDRRMWPYHEEYRVKPYRRYFTPPEVALLSQAYAVPASDLKGLAQAIRDGESMAEYKAVDAGSNVIASEVVSVGATQTRLYCTSRENLNYRYDWYDHGGRFYGVLTGAEYEGEFPWWHLSLSDDDRVADNMVPVDVAIAEVQESQHGIFDSFLTPKGKWYDGFFSESKAPHSWELWHLCRFRKGHHVILVDHHI